MRDDSPVGNAVVRLLILTACTYILVQVTVWEPVIGVPPFLVLLGYAGWWLLQTVFGVSAADWELDSDREETRS